MTADRDRTRARNREIIEAFYEKGLSRTALVAKYGLSEAAIKRMIREDRIANGPRERTVQPKDPRKVNGRPALSFDHFCTGIHVRHFMEAHNMSQTAFGMYGDLAMSRVAVGELMSGHYDYTWLELQALARLLGMTVAELHTAQQKVKEEI